MESFLRRLVVAAYGVLGVVGLFALTIWIGSTHSGFSIFLTRMMDGLSLNRTVVLEQLKDAGIFSIGWGVGVTAWLMTGQQAVTCLLSRLPRAWTLRRRRVLTSLFPVLKYLVLGGILTVLGALLVRQLWGLWTGTYDAGLVVGVILGVVNSLARAPSRRTKIDFLEANQRYVNEEKVSVFAEAGNP